MELQAMTKEELMMKVEELSINLENSTLIAKELNEKVLEHEKVENELRAENDSLKQQNEGLKKESQSFYEWWQDECKKVDKLKESMKTAAIAVNSICYAATN